MNIQIRVGETQDMSSILDLIQELAVFEKEPDAVIITVADLVRDYNGGLFQCYVAEDNDELIGMALYYYRYSTWKGKTLHLEDLVVKASHRRRGVGKLLLDTIVQKAKQEQVGRLEWNVLDWNTNAIAFYETYGASILKDWYLVQMDKKDLKNF